MEDFHAHLHRKSVWDRRSLAEIVERYGRAAQRFGIRAVHGVLVLEPKMGVDSLKLLLQERLRRYGIELKEPVVYVEASSVNLCLQGEENPEERIIKAIERVKGVKIHNWLTPWDLRYILGLLEKINDLKTAHIHTSIPEPGLLENWNNLLTLIRFLRKRKGARIHLVHGAHPPLTIEISKYKKFYKILAERLGTEGLSLGTSSPSGFFEISQKKQEFVKKLKEMGFSVGFETDFPEFGPEAWKYFRKLSKLL